MSPAKTLRTSSFYAETAAVANGLLLQFIVTNKLVGVEFIVARPDFAALVTKLAVPLGTLPHGSFRISIHNTRFLWSLHYDAWG